MSETIFCRISGREMKQCACDNPDVSNSSGMVGSKPWYHKTWRLEAYRHLNSICERLGCTYAGGEGEDRRCEKKHFDCDSLRDLVA